MYKGHLLSTANWVTQLTSGVWGSSETDKLPGERCPPLTDAGWGALGLHSGGRGLCTCTQGHFWCVHKSSVCHHASTDCLTTEKHKVLLGVKCLGCGLWAVGSGSGASGFNSCPHRRQPLLRMEADSRHGPRPPQRPHSPPCLYTCRDSSVFALGSHTCLSPQDCSPRFS